MKLEDFVSGIRDLFSHEGDEQERAQRAAQKAASYATYLARSADASTQQLKHRLMELEQDNAFLGLVLLRLLKVLGNSRTLDVQSFAAEIREAVARPEMAPALSSLNGFREMLGLPPPTKGPVASLKPSPPPIRPPAGPKKAPARLPPQTPAKPKATTPPPGPKKPPR